MTKKETEHQVNITVKLSDDSVDLTKLNKDLDALAENLKKLKNLGLVIKIDK